MAVSPAKIVPGMDLMIPYIDRGIEDDDPKQEGGESRYLHTCCDGSEIT